MILEKVQIQIDFALIFSPSEKDYLLLINKLSNPST